jgi:hypothetical protein
MGILESAAIALSIEKDPSKTEIIALAGSEAK